MRIVMGPANAPRRAQPTPGSQRLAHAQDRKHVRYGLAFCFGFELRQLLVAQLAAQDLEYRALR